jgi:glycosyltransferase involved in cell wall biosynthesis
MKILLVSSSFFPKIDGSTRCVYDHARKMAGGNTVYLETRGVPGAPKDQMFEGIHVRRSSVSFRSSTPLGKVSLLLDQMLQIVLLQRKLRFDVIHVHGYISGLAALPSKYLFRVPLVITTHGTELLWPRQLWWKNPLEVKLSLIFERFVLVHCSVVIAQSEGVKEYMLRIYGQEIEKRIRIIHTGVDQKKFEAPAITNPSRTVLFVGALSEIKGVSCLLDAFSRVHKIIPHSRLMLVGSGPNAEHYKEMVFQLELVGSVDFLGPVRDDARLVKLYAQSDIVVLPSNVGGPISCTLMEGLSCGRAVISTDVPGGIPDVLSPGVGLLMKREDRDQLASFLLRLMQDEGYLAALSRNARKTVEEKYTLDSMVSQLTQLYRGLAA